MNDVKQLAREAIAAGFYNIDVDTSTLVDLSKPNLDEQQRTNYEQAADIALFVRRTQPEGIDISLGGEIGEVGTENSTVEELHAYMDGFNRTLEKLAPGVEGLSKISVQSGTTHGGVVLADGTIADVQIDFGTLERLSRRCARELRTLRSCSARRIDAARFRVPQFPDDRDCGDSSRDEFPDDAVTISMPDALRDEIYEWLRENAKDERKPRIPTSSSSTRRERRHSARSSGDSGISTTTLKRSSRLPMTTNSSSSLRSLESAGLLTAVAKHSSSP